MTAAQQYWYNRMFSVTARGFIPQMAVMGGGEDGNDIHEGWKEVEWTFDMDCPQEMRDLIARYNPKPMYNVKSYNPKWNSVEWGYVSVWSDDARRNGYENLIHRESKDTAILEFAFQVRVNGVKYETPVYHATARKLA